MVLPSIQRIVAPMPSRTSSTTSNQLSVSEKADRLTIHSVDGEGVSSLPTDATSFAILDVSKAIGMSATSRTLVNRSAMETIPESVVRSNVSSAMWPIMSRAMNVMSPP